MMTTNWWVTKRRLFTPFDITTYAWHDSDAADTITIGTGVSQWDDKKGNGINVINDVGSEQPTVNTTGVLRLNNRNTLLFKKLFDQHLKLNNTNLFTVATMHFLIVSKAITVANDPESFLSWNGGVGGDWEIQASNSPQFDGLLKTDGFLPENNASYNQTDVTDWAMWGAEFIENTEFSSWFNGVQQTVKETTEKLDITTIDYRFATDRPNNFPCHCAIAECVVFNPNDREKVEGYLAWKWGLQTSLPALHPYKSAAP